MIAALTAAGVLGAYVEHWVTVHETNSARIAFFVVMLIAPIAAVLIAPAIDGIGRPILTMGACVALALIAVFEVIALSATSSIGAWLILSAGLAFLAAAALTFERSMPVARSLAGHLIGCALGASYVALAGLLEARIAPV